MKVLGIVTIGTMTRVWTLPCNPNPIVVPDYIKGLSKTSLNRPSGIRMGGVFEYNPQSGAYLRVPVGLWGATEILVGLPLGNYAAPTFIGTVFNYLPNSYLKGTGYRSLA